MGVIYNILVGIPGNERTDRMARQGAKSAKLEVPLTLNLNRTNNLISSYIDRNVFRA